VFDLKLKQDKFLEVVSLICTEYFFDLYFKYFTNLKTLELAVAFPRCSP